jgi:hypothetical protein
MQKNYRIYGKPMLEMKEDIYAPGNVGTLRSDESFHNTSGEPSTEGLM